MDNIKIRLSSQKDLKTVNKLFWLLTLYNRKNRPKDEVKQRRDEEAEKNLSNEEAKKVFSNKNCYFLVAETNDKEIIGYGYIDKSKSRIVIEELYVKKEFRRKGIGKKILTGLENYLKKNKLRAMVEVFPWNKKAIRFYNKNGYRTKFIVLEKKGF
ncbi:MAG TPA: GNAT family N-acetyltransferase [Candidatus Bathyarchaeia archaeon]|nr:GNAT family N-acetyltransferase [Candidatus Bathyarchaeia archaeon]